VRHFSGWTQGGSGGEGEESKRPSNWGKSKCMAKPVGLGHSFKLQEGRKKGGCWGGVGRSGPTNHLKGGNRIEEQNSPTKSPGM